ncbi:MAG: hypothetical protein H7267_02230 [Sandarakinorhabdus sp.]|nr:hypothetical protein [Sandarakinorhabdus sp.]
MRLRQCDRRFGARYAVRLVGPDIRHQPRPHRRIADIERADVDSARRSDPDGRIRRRRPAPAGRQLHRARGIAHDGITEAVGEVTEVEVETSACAEFEQP